MIKIRKAKISDSRGIVNLMRKPDIYNYVGRGYTYKNVKFWLKEWSNDCIVVESNERVVGLLWFYTSEFGEPYLKHIRIFDLAVDPEYRNRGIGTMLVKRMLKDCKRSGVKKIMSYVETNNKPSQRIHEYLKFKKEGKVSGLFIRKGKLVDGYIYGKVL
jgi:ribosomal protein S18 acetylase RimI-like enzyme